MWDIIKPINAAIDDLKERVKKLEEAGIGAKPAKPKSPAKDPTEETPTIKVPWGKKER